MGIFASVGKAISSLFSGDARPAPNTRPNGGDGVEAYGGFLPTNERRHELIGERKWVTFADAHHTAIVATGLRYRCDLLAGTNWHAQPNERGGKDAQRGVDIVTQGLLKAQMPRPWPMVVRKSSLFKINGFSLHEWTVRRRDDGMIVFADIAHRPPHTIQRWDKPSEQEPWRAVGQLTRAGHTWVIPRNRLFYCWDDTLTDSPEGVGLMRHVIELVRRLGVLEGLEGFAYETDLRGMPIGRAPIDELMAQAEIRAGGGSDREQRKAFVAERTARLRGVISEIIKSPEKLQWLLLDSATYRNVDQSAVSAVQKWALELLRGDARGLTDINAVIGRLQLEIARVLGIEFVMMGGSKSGSLAMHADKTSIFATSLQATLTEIAASATNDLARPLVALNGLDPETCTPTLVAEPISTDAVEATCQALLYLAQAGLAPDDEAIGVIRDRLHLPAPPAPTPAQLGMLGARPGGKRPGARASQPGAPPDPSRGEVDVKVDDLGAQPRGKRWRA